MAVYFTSIYLLVGSTEHRQGGARALNYDATNGMIVVSGQHTTSPFVDAPFPLITHFTDLKFQHRYDRLIIIRLFSQAKFGVFKLNSLEFRHQEVHS